MVSQPLDHLDVQMSLLERKLKIHGMQLECVIVGVSKTGSRGVVRNHTLRSVIDVTEGITQESPMGAC